MVLWGKNCLNMDDFHHPTAHLNILERCHKPDG